jgi:succinyl-CoA synthetase beta subunit
MVNGAGLAMATMHIIKLYGAEPNNPSTWRRRDQRKVTEAFKKSSMSGSTGQKVSS